MASHFAKLQVADIRRETEDCVSIAFAVPEHLHETFRFIQGQNITIRTRIEGEEIRRSYSICSSPFDKELRIAVKKVPRGLFSTYANDQLHVGDELDVLPPTGRFYTQLDPSKPKHYLAFAAGSGITPILSLIKTTLATEPESHFTLVYGNRHRPSIIFREELEGLKNRYMHRFALHHILSREKVDIGLHQGRIDAAKCGELCGKLIDLNGTDEIFLCGPAEMIFTIKSWLEEKAFDPRKIHFELFHTQEGKAAGRTTTADTTTTAPLEGKTSQVTIRLDGNSFDFELPVDGDSILDGALMQGADLPFACKGGVCCTCRARLLEGKVEMEVNYALEEEELKAGFILTCQSHPRTEKVVIDFDSK
ncbi:MAG: phenylacetic acid degradation protein [Sphingobacteriales bacterium 50-39]|nr:phenylacetate-CoA oxygenase/reductase subunit PaaK [Sphingobacteriales bacterium]OJW57522.1 MAG: phenylacetic acid degradation protein [Sphingobacteriales bacterium 50-39]